jgi:outer membrane protein assembly factor BamB
METACAGEFRGAGALSPDGSVVYWGAFDRYLYAAETSTGKVRWRYRTAGRHLGTPWVDSAAMCLFFPRKNRVYLLSAEGSLLGTLDCRPLSTRRRRL